MENIIASVVLVSLLAICIYGIVDVLKQIKKIK